MLGWVGISLGGNLTEHWYLLIAVGSLIHW